MRRSLDAALLNLTFRKPPFRNNFLRTSLAHQIIDGAGFVEDQFEWFFVFVRKMDFVHNRVGVDLVFGSFE